MRDVSYFKQHLHLFNCAFPVPPATAGGGPPAVVRALESAERKSVLESAMSPPFTNKPFAQHKY